MAPVPTSRLSMSINRAMVVRAPRAMPCSMSPVASPTPADPWISREARPAAMINPNRMAMRRSGTARRGMSRAPAMPTTVGMEDQ